MTKRERIYALMFKHSLWSGECPHTTHTCCPRSKTTCVECVADLLEAAVNEFIAHPVAP